MAVNWLKFKVRLAMTVPKKVTELSTIIFDSLPEAKGIYAMVMSCVRVCVCVCVCDALLVNMISQEGKYG